MFVPENQILSREVSILPMLPRMAAPLASPSFAAVLAVVRLNTECKAPSEVREAECGECCEGVLCCTVQCCAVLCSAVQCCTVLCCAVQWSAVLCCAVQCCAVQCYAVLCSAVLCCTVQCCTVLCCRRVPSKRRHVSAKLFHPTDSNVNFVLSELYTALL